MASRIDRSVLRALAPVETQLAEFLASDNAEAVKESCGLVDGGTIVRDYLSHGEAGLALEHLVYMVTESGLMLSREAFEAIAAAAQATGESSSIWEPLLSQVAD